MANVLTLKDKYNLAIDETYVQEGVTRVLDAPASKINFQGAKTVKIQKISTSGLSNVVRGGTPVNGAITVEEETHTLNYDRGKSFVLDVMDAEETGVGLGMAGAEFMRSDVIPEIDAIRFQKLVSKNGYGAVPSANLTASTVAPALDTAILAMNNASVPRANRVIFCTWDVIDLLEKADGFTRNVDYTLPGNVGKVVTAYKGVPLIGVEPSRFYTAITLLNTEAGGFEPAVGAKGLNFILVYVPDVQYGVIKYTTSDIIPDGQNANTWGDVMKFRIYHDLIVLDNKTKAIYAHSKA